MNWKSIQNLLTDQRAVSPVLGVALLIAITVILAGVIGFVVLGVQAGGADDPSATLKFEGDAGDIVTMTHNGGDKLDGDNLQVKVITSGTTGAADLSGTTVTTGDTVDVTSSAAGEGDVIRVVWQDPNSEREVLLAEYTVEA